MHLDQDVEAVAAYMQASVPAARLVAVASAIEKIAPLLWGHYSQETVRPLTLPATPLADGPRTRSAASECVPD
jgi:hypothetical protein